METQDTPPERQDEAAEPSSVLALVWVYPEERFTVLSADVVTLGRDAECSTQLEGNRVSRLHASIRRAGPIHVLRDAGSRNGTRHNGARVAEAHLEPGDVLRLGDWVAVVARVPREVVQDKALTIEPIAGLVIGPSLRPAWQKLARAAPSTLPVLLEGATGTGKELFARAVHEVSGRPGKLVAVNCAALPESLAEAQLFGHTRGAFTGAGQASEGLFGAAHDGTLFLDEVMDLPLLQQAKLLRAIEEKAVTRLGETAPQSVDVRVVAASQRSLTERVERGLFREDLLARLCGVTVHLPRLADRREDVPQLFVRFFKEAGGDAARLRSSLIEALCCYRWPHNVREVVQAARRAALLLDSGSEVGAERLAEILQRPPTDRGATSKPSAEPVGPSAPPAANEALSRRRGAWLRRHWSELQALLEAMRTNGGNVSAAARAIGISRQRAQRLIAAKSDVNGDN